MEARADREGLRSGALSTVEAMVVSMEAATYSIFAAFSEAGVNEPDTAQEDVRRREDRGAAQSKETIE